MNKKSLHFIYKHVKDSVFKHSKRYNIKEKNVILIDAYNVLHKSHRYYFNFYKESCIEKSHIHATFMIIIRCLYEKFIPIFVFDGPCLEEKKNKIEARRKAREEYRKLCTQFIDTETGNITDEEAYTKNLINTFTLTKKMTNECKELLHLFGLPYINAKHDADKACAFIYKKFPEKIYGIISDDFDTLMFGGCSIFKNFRYLQNNMYVQNLNIIDICNRALICCNSIRFYKNLDEIDKFTPENLLDFYVLNGTDYCINNKSIEINLQTEQLFEYFVCNNFCVKDTLNELFNEKIINNIDESYHIFTKTKEIFTDPDDNFDNIDFKLSGIDHDGVYSYLSNNCKINKYYIKNMVSSIECNYFFL